MTQRRWIAMDEVFEQLEEAETEHVLQLWERRRSGAKPERTAPAVDPTTPTVVRRQRVRAAR